MIMIRHSKLILSARSRARYCFFVSNISNIRLNEYIKNSVSLINKGKLCVGFVLENYKNHVGNCWKVLENESNTGLTSGWNDRLNLVFPTKTNSFQHEIFCNNLIIRLVGFVGSVGGVFCGFESKTDCFYA